MARSVNFDPLTTHNFALIDIPSLTTTAVPFNFAFALKAARSALINKSFVSFQSISMPTVELQTKEIVEGNWPMTRHVAVGSASGGQVTITHAVFPEGIDMFVWMRQSIFGLGAPRRTLLIIHLGKDRLIPRKITKLERCIPISWQVSSDLDAQGSGIAVESITLQVEDVDNVLA